MHFHFKTSIFLILLSLAGVSGVCAQEPQYLFPATAFNEAEAAQLMAEGTARITGTAKLRKRGVDYLPWQGDRIDLFPVTPYLLEFAALRKKHHKGKKIAAMSNEAFTYRIEGKFIDNKGTFEFRDLKPGKYYIATWITFEREYQETVQTGTEVGYNYYGNAAASWPIYTTYTHKYTLDDEVTGIVEVKSNGETVTTVISN